MLHRAVTERRPRALTLSVALVTEECLAQEDEAKFLGVVIFTSAGSRSECNQIHQLNGLKKRSQGELK